MTLSNAELVALVAIVVALPLSALLAITDTVLTQTTRARVEALIEEQPANRARRSLGRLLEHRDESLHPVLLLEAGCDVVAAGLSGLLLYRLGGTVAFVVGLVLFVPPAFMLAVSLPRAWALHNLNSAIRVAGPVGTAVQGVVPVRLLGRASLRLARRLFPPRDTWSLTEVGDHSFAMVAGSPTEADRIDVEGHTLLHSVMDFGATLVREIMVPRPDMVALSDELTLDEALARVRDEGYSRFPVIKASLDDIVGIVYAKDVFVAALSPWPPAGLAELVRPARFVPELKPLASLLREMQQEKLHLAIVVDEYGGTAGLVTMEDIIEEIVGDIEDEFDDGRDVVEHLADGAVRIEARLSLDEVNELLELQLPEGGWDTVGGLLYDHFRAIPTVGDTARFGNHEIEVVAMRGRRIGTVVVRPVPEPEVVDAAEGEDAAAGVAELPAAGGSA